MADQTFYGRKTDSFLKKLRFSDCFMKHEHVVWLPPVAVLCCTGQGKVKELSCLMWPTMKISKEQGKTLKANRSRSVAYSQTRRALSPFD